MGRLMIRCPVTGREISSGIEADRSRFRASAVFFARSYCEFCRVEHEWFPRTPGCASRSPWATPDPRSVDRTMSGGTGA